MGGVRAVRMSVHVWYRSSGRHPSAWEWEFRGVVIQFRRLVKRCRQGYIRNDVELLSRGNGEQKHPASFVKDPNESPTSP